MCKGGGGGWGSWPQTDELLPQSLLTGQFFDDDNLHCLLWVLSVYENAFPFAGKHSMYLYRSWAVHRRLIYVKTSCGTNFYQETCLTFFLNVQLKIFFYIYMVFFMLAHRIRVKSIFNALLYFMCIIYIFFQVNCESCYGTFIQATSI
jgi:hypothetical protein